jgi:hypothetical protein
MSVLPPISFTPPQQALWWLKRGALEMGEAWEQAHAICQTAEGTYAYDLVHALAHWIEGDETNRDYWYRRVGAGWTRAPTIEAEWTAIERELAAL